MKRNNLFCSALLLLSVLLLTLSQPSLFFEDGLSFLAWGAYISLFLLTERISIKKSFIYGAFYGSLSYFCICWWFSSFGAVAISFVCLLFAFYNSILFFLIVWSLKIFPNRYKKFFWIFRVLLLLSVEYARTHGIFAFSYGIIGYSQWKNPFFLKFSSLFGVMGVSFVILLVNSLAAKIISEKKLRENLREAASILSILFGIILFGAFARFSKPKSSLESLDVALIQNSSAAFSYTISQYIQDAENLKNYTDMALERKPETALVVWPETAVVPDILYHLKNPADQKRHALSKNLIDYIRLHDAAFLIGNNYSDSSGDHNSALYFPKNHENPKVYSKNHLVPFTEFWPSFLEFKFFEKIKESLGCDLFTAGTKCEIFTINGLDFAVPICFEDSFAPLVRKMKLLGADFLVNISNDAWSHSDAARKMHLSMSAFRCAEFAVPMVRSTADGITCVVGCDGKVLSKIKSAQDDFLCEKIWVSRDSKTLYFVIGDSISIIMTVFVMLSLLILSVRFVKVRSYGRR